MTKTTGKATATKAAKLVKHEDADVRSVAASALTQTDEPDIDQTAQAIADRAASLVGQLTDTPYPGWEASTGRGRDFWRELARAVSGV